MVRFPAWFDSIGMAMKHSYIFKATLTATVIATAAFAVPKSAQAQEWNMCDWERIPTDVLNRITSRTDFDEILRRMFENCEDAALALTSRPTASVSPGNDTDSNGDRQNGPDGSDSGGGGGSGQTDGGGSGQNDDGGSGPGGGEGPGPGGEGPGSGGGGTGATFG